MGIPGDPQQREPMYNSKVTEFILLRQFGVSLVLGVTRQPTIFPLLKYFYEPEDIFHEKTTSTLHAAWICRIPRKKHFFLPCSAIVFMFSSTNSLSFMWYIIFQTHHIFLPHGNKKKFSGNGRYSPRTMLFNLLGLRRCIPIANTFNFYTALLRHYMHLWPL